MDKKEIEFICQLHGFAIRVKEIHWNTRDNDEHLLCDEILDGIYELEDRFAECAMGYDGEKFPLKALVPKIPDAQNLTTVISAFEKAVSEIARSVAVNYPHLKEGASCFADKACLARERKVEVSSPQA